MMDLLIAEISKEVTLSPAEKDKLRSFFTLRKLRRRQNVVAEGEVLDHVFFVEKGLLRGYLKRGKEEEHIIQFAPEGFWIPDTIYEAQDLRAQFHIDAVEPAQVLSISIADCLRLLEQMPKIEKYFRVVMQKRLYALHLRVINFITNFTEDRYRAFVSVYPDLVRRVPQRMIASYLGIKPETLSRNRKKIAKGKQPAVKRKPPGTSPKA